MKPGGVLPTGGRVAALLLAALASGACGPDPERPLGVFAAASLTDLLRDSGARDALPAYEVHHAGSDLLLRQVQAGAPADLLVLARAFAPGELPAGVEPRPLMGTRLVLACAADRVAVPPADWNAWRELSPPPRLAVADPELAPAGQVARDALRRRGDWDALSDRLVLAPDVRAACTWVQLGELDYVLCYRADARALDGLVECFPFDDAAVSYEAAVLAEGERGERARAWLDAWGAPEVRALVRRHHFEAP